MWWAYTWNRRSYGGWQIYKENWRIEFVLSFWGRYEDISEGYVRKNMNNWPLLMSVSGNVETCQDFLVKDGKRKPMQTWWLKYNPGHYFYRTNSVPKYSFWMYHIQWLQYTQKVIAFQNKLALANKWDNTNIQLKWTQLELWRSNDSWLLFFQKGG